MKVKDLTKNVIVTYDIQVEVDGEVRFYKRYDENDWTYEVSYDIFGEDVGCSDELSSQLEKLFQEYKELV